MYVVGLFTRIVAAYLQALIGKKNHMAARFCKDCNSKTGKVSCEH